MIAHILACIVLGALWRLAKGDTLRHFFLNGKAWPGTAPIATWTFAPLCALAIAPLWGALDPGKFALALIGFGVASAVFLLVDADNGGNGKPLLRFLFLWGLGYWWANRYRPDWHAKIGEPWLGGVWFGFMAAAIDVAVAARPIWSVWLQNAHSIWGSS